MPRYHEASPTCCSAKDRSDRRDADLTALSTCPGDALPISVKQFYITIRTTPTAQKDGAPARDALGPYDRMWGHHANCGGRAVATFVNRGQDWRSVTGWRPIEQIPFLDPRPARRQTPHRRMCGRRCRSCLAELVRLRSVTDESHAEQHIAIPIPIVMTVPTGTAQHDHTPTALDPCAKGTLHACGAGNVTPKGRLGPRDRNGGRNNSSLASSQPGDHGEP